MEKQKSVLKKLENTARGVAAVSFATDLITTINTSVLTQWSAVFGLTTFVARKILNVFGKS